jgi:recombination protein RecA
MAEKKKAATKETKKPANRRLTTLAKARKTILKATKQKPLQPSEKPLGFVSTGSFPVDMLIGGTPTKDGKGLVCPGFPRRRIIELYGPESSGKTTLLIAAMVQAQKAGGTAMFIDFEHSLDHNYAKALGLSYDEDQLLVYQPDSMEEGFKMMFVAIAAGIDIVGVDSVAAMVPKDEMVKGFDDAAKIGIVARLFSSVLPKFVAWLQKYPRLPDDKDAVDPDHPGTTLVFVNQIRALISTGGGSYGGDSENTSGGKALKFFAYLRLRMARIKSEFVERKDQITGKKRRFPYGNLTNVKVVKSKLDAKQGHSTQMFIRYGVGIDDYISIIETGVVQKVISKKGSYYFLRDQKFQGKEKFRQFLLDNPKVYEALRQKLAQAANFSALDTGFELDDEDELLEGFDLESDGLDADIAAEVEEVIESEFASESDGA